jgi:hypothetical protein
VCPCVCPSPRCPVAPRAVVCFGRGGGGGGGGHTDPARNVCVCVLAAVCLQVAVALGLEPDLAAAKEAAKHNSFLPRLALLDPRTLDPATAEAVADILAGAGTGGTGGAGEAGPGHAAAAAMNDLLKQLVHSDPSANTLANGLRPLPDGPRLSLHASRVSATLFPVFVRGADDSVTSVQAKLPLSGMATGANPFYDAGVPKYFAAAGAALPPTPLVKRKVLAAAVWCVWPHPPLISQWLSVGYRVPGFRSLLLRAGVVKQGGWLCYGPPPVPLQPCACRVDYLSQNYVAGILEEDDNTRPDLQLVKSAPGPGRTFTLYLYDRDKRQVRQSLLAPLVGAGVGMRCSGFVCCWLAVAVSPLLPVLFASSFSWRPRAGPPVAPCPPPPPPFVGRCRRWFGA